MPATIREIRGITHKKGDQAEINRLFIIQAATDYADAMATLYGFIEPIFGGLFLNGGDCREIGGGTYNGFARYTRAGQVAAKQPLTPDDPEQWEFTAEGGTQRITQSIKTIKTYHTGGSFSDEYSPFGGAIGVGQDGSIEGVEVATVGARIRARRVITAAQATGTYLNTLMRAKDGVNIAPWRGLAAGEVKFRIGSTQTRTNGDVELIREWDVSPNQTGIAVGDITGIAKKGWQYLWIHYEDKEDATNKIIARVPKYAIVEQVYPEIDFTILEPPAP